MNNNNIIEKKIGWNKISSRLFYSWKSELLYEMLLKIWFLLASFTWTCLISTLSKSTFSYDFNIWLWHSTFIMLTKFTDKFFLKKKIWSYRHNFSSLKNNLYGNLRTIEPRIFFLFFCWYFLCWRRSQKRSLGLGGLNWIKPYSGQS